MKQNLGAAMDICREKKMFFLFWKKEREWNWFKGKFVKWEYVPK